LKKRFPRQFPNFKQWLSLDDDPELSALYRYPGQLVLFAAEGNENFMPAFRQNFDLRDYSAFFSSRQSGVTYRGNGSLTRTADFIDYGKRIVLSKKHDESSVLAALQLASQRWGPYKSAARKSTSASASAWRRNTIFSLPTRN
jgi:hypothetical protein